MADKKKDIQQSNKNLLLFEKVKLELQKLDPSVTDEQVREYTDKVRQVVRFEIDIIRGGKGRVMNVMKNLI